jgi:hypothetical protein
MPIESWREVRAQNARARKKKSGSRRWTPLYLEASGRYCEDSSALSYTKLHYEFVTQPLACATFVAMRYLFAVAKFIEVCLANGRESKISEKHKSINNVQ